ncbi:hypothetical protein HK102_013171, partial [Quaeritorhiza haematococci]
GPGRGDGAGGVSRRPLGEDFAGALRLQCGAGGAGALPPPEVADDADPGGPGRDAPGRIFPEPGPPRADGAVRGGGLDRPGGLEGRGPPLRPPAM